MCPTSRSFGIWLCFSLALLLLALASVTCSAQAYIWQTNNAYRGTWYGATTAEAAKAGGDSALGENIAGFQIVTATSASCSPSGAPTTLSEGSACTVTETLTCLPRSNCTGLSGSQTVSLSLTAIAASSEPSAVACSGKAGGDTYVTNTGTATTNGEDKEGCAWSESGDVSVCADLGSGMQCSEEVTYSGAYSAGTGAGTNAANNCVSGGGTTACVQASQPGCGTFNGDQVCVPAIPNNSCVFYPSGGSACSVSGTTVASGAPVSASGGAAGVSGSITPAAPNATGGENCAADACTSSVNYYSSTTTAASSAGAVGASTGVNVGNGGSGSGAGSGLGSCGSGSSAPCSVSDANAAANGDCSAGDCSQSGNPLPSYDWSSDSWSGATTSFWNAVSGGPLGTAVGGLSSAWPDAGECPSLTVALTTVQVTADYGTEFCDLWNSAAAPYLAAVMLAVWSIVAVYVFLSA